MQQKTLSLSAGVQKEISARVQKETILQGVISEDFGPDVERWHWGLSDSPELSEGVLWIRVIEDRLVGAMCQLWPRKSIWLSEVDPSFQVESQIEVQKGCRRTGTRDGALFCPGFLPGGIGTEAGGAANGGILALNLSVEHDLCGRHSC
jgi:hypothetical protein